MHAGEQKRSPILSSSVTNPLPARMVAGSKRGELYKNQPDGEKASPALPASIRNSICPASKDPFPLYTLKGPRSPQDTGFTRAERMIPVLQGGGAGGETLPFIQRLPLEPFPCIGRERNTVASPPGRVEKTGGPTEESSEQFLFLRNRISFPTMLRKDLSHSALVSPSGESLV